MSEASVSIDALLKVKAGLKDYDADISGFSARIRQVASDVVKSAAYEMQKIARQIKDGQNEIHRLKTVIRSLSETKSRMVSEQQTAEQKLEVTQKQLTSTQETAVSLERQIAEQERAAARLTGEELQKANETIRRLRSQLAQTRSEIGRLSEETQRLQEQISQSRRQIHDAEVEKAKAEEDLRNAERLLAKLQDKEERMKGAQVRMNGDMDALLTASKSFEIFAVSETERGSSNVEKCVTTIDSYLSG